MADTKISALPASTTPLAGTEVLPIVQSSTTKQVSVANLTAGRAFEALGMTLTSTDAGATAAPLLDLYRDSASPAASDTLGEIEFNGEDSAGNKQQYALIHASILSPTSTAEAGQIHFETATAGASTEKMIIGTSNLVVNDIGAVYNVRIEGDTDANLFYTDATNDRVGVGTISPATKLQVNGTVTATSLLVGSATATANFNFNASQSADTTAGGMVENTSNTASATAVMRYKNSGSTFAYTGLGSPSRDVYGTLGPNVLAMYTGDTAGITLMVDANGPITFATGSSVTERMRIESGGSVKLKAGNLYWDEAGTRYISNVGDSSSNINIQSRGYTTFSTGGSTVGAGTEAMRITSAGDLLLGGTSNGSNAKFISESTANANQLGFRYTGVATYYWGCDSSGNAILNKDGTERMRITSGGLVSITGAGTEVLALNKSGGPSAYLQPVSSTDAGLQVKDSGGTVTLTVGTTTTTVALQGGTVSSGTGIAFPATQNASANANTLDDYEEGTFTPTISGSTSAGTGTYTTQSGSYTKIGRQVSFRLQVFWSAHTGTGGLLVTSLPFTCSGIGGATIGLLNDLTLTALNYAMADIVDGTTSVRFRQYPVGGTGITDVAMSNASNIVLSGTYFV